MVSEMIIAGAPSNADAGKQKRYTWKKIGIAMLLLTASLMLHYPLLWTPGFLPRIARWARHKKAAKWIQVCIWPCADYAIICHQP